MYSGNLLLPLLLVGSTKSFIPSGSRTRSCQQQCFSSEENVSEVSISSYGLDPSSEAARTIIVEDLGLSEHNYQKLLQLSELVTEWNEKINLISRKDCNPSTVFGRHILPSVAVAAVSNDQSNNKENPLATARTVIDIGTGGGFPGLPLAILYPDIDFVLLDSVAKKLTAVQAMADALRLENVQIHHGRAEDMTTTDRRRFDVATGRSVSAIPQFCAWMHHLLEPRTGHLMYWIGGDVANELLDKARSETVIQDVLPGVESDKRILVFPATAVSQIARESGIKVQRLQLNKKKTSTQSSKNKSRGEWAKKKSRRDDEPKDGGYSTFQRYSSSSWAAGDSSSSNDSSHKVRQS